MAALEAVYEVKFLSFTEQGLSVKLEVRFV